MQKTKLLSILGPITHFIILLFTITSCGASKEENISYDKMKQDSISVYEWQEAMTAESLAVISTHYATDSILNTDSIRENTKSKIDTAIANSTAGDKLKSASLGYSFPPMMVQGEVKDVNVYVSIINPSVSVIDTLKKTVEAQIVFNRTSSDTTVYSSKNIILYKNINIVLVDPAKDFEITRIHPQDSQDLDTLRGNKWHWSITSKTDKPQATLILQQTAVSAQGRIEDWGDHKIVIKIKVDKKSMIRSMFTYLRENPAKSIAMILSLLGFIGYLIKWKLNQGKKPE